MAGLAVLGLLRAGHAARPAPSLYRQGTSFEHTIVLARENYQHWRDGLVRTDGDGALEAFDDPRPALYQRILDNFPGRPPRQLVGDRGGWRQLGNVHAWFSTADPTAIEDSIIAQACERLRTTAYGNRVPSHSAVQAHLARLSGAKRRYESMHVYANLVRCEEVLRSLEMVRDGAAFAAGQLQRVDSRTDRSRDSLLPIVTGAARTTDSLASIAVELVLRDTVLPVDGWASELVDATTKALALRLRGLGVPSIVFCTRTTTKGYLHFYETFGHRGDNPDRKLYSTGGRLVLLDLETLQERDLVRDLDGALRDPQVHYDARKLLFSYRRGGAEQHHLYEMSLEDSTMRQITTGIYDDIEPIYTPADSIIFCSSRLKRYVPCFYAPVAVLYKCGLDGENLRPLSANVETECTPWMLPDGRVAFMRWEYTDRDHFNFHQLWTCNPDGTGQMTYFGNMLFDDGSTLLDAKPIPGTHQVVAVNSHGHGRNEHAGPVVILDPLNGPDDLTRQTYVTPKLKKRMIYRDPYAITDSLFLVARHDQILLVDRAGAMAPLYTLRDVSGVDVSSYKYWVHEPRPLVPRPREHIIPPHVDYARGDGTMYLVDVTHGRNMDGVKRGEITQLLVLEVLPKPTHTDGHTEPISYDGTFMLERVLGTVPVEPDGSAHFIVPAMRPVFFVAMDSAGNAVKRMHSFVSVMPGEMIGCAGCHENRTDVSPNTRIISALTRPPDTIAALDNIPRIFDYYRDIQPILDKHCVRCHSNTTRDGGVVLTGDLGPWFCASYVTIIARKLVSPSSHATGVNRGGNRDPYEIGAGSGPLFTLVRDGHHRVELSSHELDMLRYWIESGSVYAGAYAGLNTLDGYRYPVDNDVVTRRCIGCHDRRLFGYWGGPRKANFSETRGLWVNFSHPESSMVLLAPLARDAGGYGLCSDSAGTPVAVYPSKSCADYQAMLTAIRAAAQEGLRNRFEREGFSPTTHWVREMKRYGVLPRDWSMPDSGFSVYDTEDDYFRSFWYRPLDSVLAGDDVSSGRRVE